MSPIKQLLELLFCPNQSHAYIGLRNPGHFSDLPIGKLLQIEQHNRAVEFRQLIYGLI